MRAAAINDINDNAHFMHKNIINDNNKGFITHLRNIQIKQIKKREEYK